MSKSRLFTRICKFICTLDEAVVPVAEVVVTRRIALAFRRSLGRIRLYACHWTARKSIGKVELASGFHYP